MAKTKEATKNIAGPKTGSPKSSNEEIKPIKYEDKSEGQPELVAIFKELRTILLQQVQGNLTVQGDSGGQVHLYSIKPVEIMGKKRGGVYFASLLVQKGYVGFYLMPVYVDSFLKQSIEPELLKLLKGKSCFHIKKLDDILKSQVQKALQEGYDCYAKKGWV